MDDMLCLNLKFVISDTGLDLLINNSLIVGAHETNVP